VIVRLMGEGQYQVEDSILEQLNELDDRATAAVEAGDEPTLDQALDEMFRVVRERGKPLGDEDLSPSDMVIPPSDLTLEETRRLFAHDGFIPDLPAPE
jgi:PspA-Associated protein